MKLLKNCLLFDGVSDEPIEDGYVVTEGDRIREVGAGPVKANVAEVIDLGGAFLMPGLIDLHFHAYSITFDMHSLDTMPQPLKVAHASKLLAGALARGFTTVRDPAGGEIGLQLALQQGLFTGPRYFHGGKALSQTGGHGDMRPAEQADIACGCAANATFAEVVDGVEAVRRFCRNELRKGADHIKVFISGGVASPTDPVWMAQYTDEELAAAVYEAETRRKYVIAHCHTDQGARRCLELGIRSIDHCTIITEQTAQAIAEANGASYAVPTIAVLEQLVRHGEQLGLFAESMEKAREVHRSAYSSLEYLYRCGARLGFGTDLFGQTYHAMQNHEFLFRSEVISPIDQLRSATGISAEIMQKNGVLGGLRPGAYADMLCIDGNPIEDIGLMAAPERYFLGIMQGGQFFKREGF